MVDVAIRIVVAYDDSPSARRALDEALRRAAASPEYVLIAVAVAKSVPLTEQVRRGVCEQWLCSAREQAQRRGLHVDTDLRAGHPAVELLHAAAEHDADLVLIGCGSWPTELGHTAEMLMRCAPCPVMVVH